MGIVKRVKMNLVNYVQSFISKKFYDIFYSSPKTPTMKFIRTGKKIDSPIAD